MKRVWVFIVSLHSQMNTLKTQFTTKINLERMKAAKEFSASRIRGRFKYIKMIKYGQLEE